MPLDPQARTLLDQIAAIGAPPVERLPLADARAAVAALAAFAAPGPDLPVVDDLAAPGPAGDVPVRRYRPAPGDDPLPALVWFHGGGWTLGSVAEADSVCRHLAARSGCTVLSVDYRLAPEHRYPAPLDDCVAAVRWAAREAAALGVDPGRLSVGGDSAGGNLAAAVCLRARDTGGPPLSFQLLVYPVTDSGMGTPSYRENGDGYLLRADTMRWFWDNYLGPDGDPLDPYASIVHGADLTGVPPALVITAEYDPLRDEGESYAKRLADAGVPATVSRYNGQIHGFFVLAGLLDAAWRAIDEAAAALRGATGASRTG